MAKFVINKKYLPKERAGAGQLFIILSRTAKAEDIEAADEVLKVLSARFPFATLINSSLLDASPLEGQSETEQQSWLDSIQPVWLNFIRQQQSEFQVADAATALVGVGELGALVLELAKQQAPVAGRLIAFGSRFVNLPEVPVSLDQTLHLFHAASDAEVDAKHSHIAQMAIDNLEGDCTIDLVQGIDDSLDPALITQMRVRLETCIPLRILREVQEAAGK
ncbi:MAG: hypothetical protein GX342_00145 [Alcaligenaceae bacterium]|jgi:phospholipase/carboxylesterase|nr:hypothetical protein [Alcaligenaceae bacterium]